MRNCYSAKVCSHPELAVSYPRVVMSFVFLGLSSAPLVLHPDLQPCLPPIQGP